MMVTMLQDAKQNSGTNPGPADTLANGHGSNDRNSVAEWPALPTPVQAVPARPARGSTLRRKLVTPARTLPPTPVPHSRKVSARKPEPAARDDSRLKSQMKELEAQHDRDISAMESAAAAAQCRHEERVQRLEEQLEAAANAAATQAVALQAELQHAREGQVRASESPPGASAAEEVLAQEMATLEAQLAAERDARRDQVEALEAELLQAQSVLAAGSLATEATSNDTSEPPVRHVTVPRVHGRFGIVIVGATENSDAKHQANGAYVQSILRPDLVAAGLCVGDRILQVDGADVRTQSYREIYRLLAARQEAVELTVQLQRASAESLLREELRMAEDVANAPEHRSITLAHTGSTPLGLRVLAYQGRVFVSGVVTGSVVDLDSRINVGDSLIACNGLAMSGRPFEDVLGMLGSLDGEAEFMVESLPALWNSALTKVWFDWTAEQAEPAELSTSGPMVQLQLPSLQNASGSYGFQLTGDTFNALGGIFVDNMLPGGVAMISGLRPYDRILAINGVSMFECSHDDAKQLIQSGTPLDINVMRLGSEQWFNLLAQTHTSEQQRVSPRGIVLTSTTNGQEVSGDIRIVQCDCRHTQQLKTNAVEWDGWGAMLQIAETNEAAGLQRNDLVLAIDGFPALSNTAAAMREHLKTIPDDGQPSIQLTVLRCEIDYGAVNGGDASDPANGLFRRSQAAGPRLSDAQPPRHAQQSQLWQQASSQRAPAVPTLSPVSEEPGADQISQFPAVDVDSILPARAEPPAKSKDSFANTTTFGAPVQVESANGLEALTPAPFYHKHFALQKHPGGTGFQMLVQETSAADQDIGPGEFFVKAILPGAPDSVKQLALGDRVVKVNGVAPTYGIDDLQSILSLSSAVELVVARQEHVPRSLFSGSALLCLSGADALEALLEVELVGGCETAFGGVFVRVPADAEASGSRIISGDRVLCIGGLSTATFTSEEAVTVLNEFMNRPEAVVEMDVGLVICRDDHFDFEGLCTEIYGQPCDPREEPSSLQYKELALQVPLASEQNLVGPITVCCVKRDGKSLGFSLAEVEVGTISALIVLAPAGTSSLEGGDRILSIGGKCMLFAGYHVCVQTLKEITDTCTIVVQRLGPKEAARYEQYQASRQRKSVESTQLKTRFSMVDPPKPLSGASLEAPLHANNTPNSRQTFYEQAPEQAAPRAPQSLGSGLGANLGVPGDTASRFTIYEDDPDGRASMNPPRGTQHEAVPVVPQITVDAVVDPGFGVPAGASAEPHTAPGQRSLVVSDDDTDDDEGGIPTLKQASGKAAATFHAPAPPPRSPGTDLSEAQDAALPSYDDHQNDQAAMAQGTATPSKKPNRWKSLFSSSKMKRSKKKGQGGGSAKSNAGNTGDSPPVPPSLPPPELGTPATAWG